MVTYRVSSTGCIATRTIDVTDSTAGKGSVGDLQKTDDLTIFPNPASDHITITSQIPGSITLSTIDGKTVLAQTIGSGTNDVLLPVELPTGVLVLRFYGNDRSIQVFKLAIKAR